MKTVLIVQEDPMSARILSKVLTKWGGLNVKHTESVEEIMEIARAREVELILMSVSCGCLDRGNSVDSIQMTQMLKADPETAHVPVILTTANAHQGDREAFMQKGAADLLATPPMIDPKKFINWIKTLLPPD